MYIVKNPIQGLVKFTGAITLWYGASSLLPSGWSVYSPAKNVFVMGGDSVETTPQGSDTHDHENGNTGTEPNHGHSGSVNSQGASTNTISTGYAGGGSGVADPHTHTSGSISANANGEHDHTVDDTDTETHLPPLKKLFWVKQESKSQIPDGCIVMWSGLEADIPEDWALCDGTNGTMDLTAYFVRGADVDGDVGVTGGTSVHDHSNSEKTGTEADHIHSLSGSISGGVGSSPNGFVAGLYPVASATHSHSLGGNSGSGGEHDHDVLDTEEGNHLPPYYYLFFIQKVA
jgi:hypothetical protein